MKIILLRFGNFDHLKPKWKVQNVVDNFKIGDLIGNTADSLGAIAIIYPWTKKGK